MFLVGLTGGIASGKSTVSSLLKGLGCCIIDADEIARQVVKPGEVAWLKIVEAFGKEILTEEGEINRQMLGDIVFQNESKRRLLNSITHPAVQKLIFWQILKAFFHGERFVLLEIPLLYETAKLLPYLNCVILVYCSKSQQIDRLMARNDIDIDRANARINAQMDIEKKRNMADIIIDNSGSMHHTTKQVQEIYSKLQSSWAHWKLRLVIIIGTLICLTWLLTKLL